MGIGLGQHCWGRKGSSRLRGYFSGGSWAGDAAQALRKNQQLLWEAVGGEAGELMAEKMMFCCFSWYLWVKQPAGTAPLPGREQPRDGASWGPLG